MIGDRGGRAMRTWTIVSAGMVALLAGVSSAVAHHAFAAEFDANKPVSLKGVITKVELINPHAWIHLDVRNDDGTVTKWMIEGGTPNTLMRRGFTRDSVKVGTEIRVEGFQARNGAKRANGRDLVLPDGKRLFMGSSGTGAPSDGRDPDEK
jgi:hypothetical protein